jgi:biopolymer transport protein TolR
MALAKRNEGSKVNSNINVTPMVDVMLVLLIIFMVITPMLQKGISVDLAKTNNPIEMQAADKEGLLRHRSDRSRSIDQQDQGPHCEPR